MAVSCCCTRLCALSAPKQWLLNGPKASRKLYRNLVLCPANSTPSLSRLITPAVSSRLVPREATRVLSSRRVHTASAGFKDVSLDENSFYEKYQDKLNKIKGLGKHRTQAKIKAARLREKSRDTAFRPPSLPTRYSLLPPPPLDSVMHTGLLTDMTADEIGVIWREYHKNKDAVCAIIPADTYVELLAKALHCPYFVYPVPHEEGYEFVFGQFSGHRCHFTSLINYQKHQENAPVSLTLTHNTDLQRSKGIVLMSGELDTAQLTSLDAQYLANQVQLYYSSDDAERYALLRQFNHEPESFDHRKLVEQLMNSGISVPASKSATAQQT